MSEVPFEEDPADMFVDTVVRSRNYALRSVQEQMGERPGGIVPLPYLVRRHDWYRSLDEEGKQRLAEAMREAVDLALYGVMLDLDNRYAMGFAGSRQRWGYSVYVQAYDDDDAYDADQASRRSRKLNLNEDGQELHDRHQILLFDTDEGVRQQSDESRETMRKVAQELKRREAEGGQAPDRGH